jgi:hypothetical protein
MLEPPASIPQCPEIQNRFQAGSLSEEDRPRVTKCKSTDGNHDHRAVEDHESGSIVDSLGPESTSKFHDTIYALIWIVTVAMAIAARHVS